MNTIAQMKLACPHCGQHIACDASLANTQLKCPACGKLFSVPAVPSPPSVATTTGSNKARFEPGPFFGMLALLILLIAIPIIVRLSMDPSWKMRSVKMPPAAKEHLQRLMRKKPDLQQRAIFFGSYFVVAIGAFYLVRSNSTAGRFRVTPWIVSALCVTAAYALEHKPAPPPPQTARASRSKSGSASNRNTAIDNHQACWRHAI